ncbi:hypothetical protein [Pasteurella multocida]|uniref:hypothetical protein n=1 Tax=Pasteurella multocida TaxID=747 RepID=UPI003CE6E970
MMAGKMKLPPRKWYNLKQASDKLSKEYNDTVTPEDILHYAGQGYFELLINIDFNIDQFDNYHLSIKGVNIDNTIKNILCLEIRGFSINPDIHRYQYENAVLTIKDNFNYSNLFSNDEYDEYDEYDNEINLDQTKPKRAILNNKNIIIKTNIEKAKGFFAIDFLNYNELFLDDSNFYITTDKIILRFSRHCKNTNGLGICFNGVDKNFNNIIKLDKDSIFIQNEELDLFMKDRVKIRSLSSIESYIEEWKNPTREINKIDSQTPQKIQKTTQKAQKTIEKTQLKPKKYYEEIVINNAIKLIIKYPEIGVYTIVNSVMSKMKKNYLIDKKMFFTDRHYVDKVKAKLAIDGIEITRHSGKTIEPPDYEIEI